LFNINLDILQNNRYTDSKPCAYLIKISKLDIDHVSKSVKYNYLCLFSITGSLMKMSKLEIMFNREQRKENKEKKPSYKEGLLDLIQIRSNLVKHLRNVEEKTG
jgi:hypothetical protein